MKKFYDEPKFDVRNYSQSLDSILTVSGGDLNGGDETGNSNVNYQSEGIL